MLRRLCLVVGLLLGACASVPNDSNRAGPALFHDAWFLPPSEPIDAGRILSLSEPMRRYLHEWIAPRMRAEGRQTGLFNALQDSGQLKIEYDATFTRTAAEAFEARTGNCLSLVLLTAALAHELGLGVQYQSVLGEQSMSRNGDLVFYNGHVNLVLNERRSDERVAATGSTAMVIDFLPDRARRGQRVQTASEQTVIAMYMNNRAAESLAAGKIDDAYWWARAAIELEPRHTDTYNTLGVVYRRHGNLPEAAAIYAYALELEPGNIAAMSNIIPVLRQLGRDREAGRWSRRLAELQPYPPFHFFAQGQRAMDAEDFATARDLFRKEIDRAAYYHEFHFWLALAYVGLHQTDLARKHFQIARDNATTQASARQYQEALEALGPVRRDRAAITAAGR